MAQNEKQVTGYFDPLPNVKNFGGKKVKDPLFKDYEIDSLTLNPWSGAMSPTTDGSNKKQFTSYFDPLPNIKNFSGKKVKDLLFKDYEIDSLITINTKSHFAITSSRIKKGEHLVVDVDTQVKSKEISTNIKVEIDRKETANVELQFLHDYAKISTSVGLKASSIVRFLGVIGTHVLALGADLSLDFKSDKFSKPNVGLSFTVDDTITSHSLNDNLDALNASYYQIVNPLTNTATGAELTHRFSTGKTTATIGAQLALHPSATVKARFNNGMASALIQYEWRPESFLTISGEVDTLALRRTPNVGVGLNLVLRS